MPLPIPTKTEKQQEFISRCIAFVKGDDPNVKNEQAAGMCYTQWDRHTKKRSGPKNEDKTPRETYVKLLGYRSSAEKRVLEVGLVSDRPDRFNTVIQPHGCITDFRNVIIDYNHNFVSTGAKLSNRRVVRTKLDNGRTVNMLMGDIEVYKDSRLRGKNGEDLGSAYEAVENGKIASVSVYFDPIETETYENKVTGRTKFEEWSLERVSLIDTVPGQEDSIIFNIRSLKNNQNNNNMEYKIGDKITFADGVKEIESVDGEYIKFKGDDKEYLAAEIEKTKIAEPAENKPAGETSPEDATKDDKAAENTEKKPEPSANSTVLGADKKPEDEKAPEGEAAKAADPAKESVDDAEKAKESETRPENQRSMTGQLVKNLAGQYGVVTKVVYAKNEGGDSVEYTIRLLGENTNISYNGKIEYEEVGGSSEDRKEWSYAQPGEVLLKLLDVTMRSLPQKEDSTEHQRALADKDALLQKATRRLKDLQDKYARLLNSQPEPKSDEDADATTDPVGGEGTAKTDDKGATFAETMEQVHAINPVQL